MNTAKWNQHPLIATVIWFFGDNASNNQTGEGATDNATEEENPTSNNERYSSIPRSSNTHTILSQNSNGESETLTFVEGALSQESASSGLVGEEVQVPRQNFTKTTEVSQSTSPNWGFWVNMTPPVQEIHTRR